MVKPVFCRGGNLAGMAVMTPLANEHSAVLGAAEDASRRLRRCRKRHPRPRLRAAL
jgi:hypothetical protein